MARLLKVASVARGACTVLLLPDLLTSELPMQQLDPTISNYFDRRFPTAPNASDEQKKADFDNALRTSTTVYIGNLAFTTSDFQLYEVQCLSQQYHGDTVQKQYYQCLTANGYLCIGASGLSCSLSVYTAKTPCHVSKNNAIQCPQW